jgi:hypothetical protein
MLKHLFCKKCCYLIHILYPFPQNLLWIGCPFVDTNLFASSITVTLVGRSNFIAY